MDTPARPAVSLSRVVRWGVTLATLAVVVWFAGDTLERGWQGLRQSSLEINAWWLLLSGTIYVVGLVPMGLYWYRVLSCFAHPAGVGQVMRAYFLGHLGKYVPGKAMVIVLRSAAVTHPLASRRAIVVSVFLETLTYMAIGAALAAAMLALVGDVDARLAIVAPALALLAGTPCLPPVARWLAMRIAGQGANRDQWPHSITWRLTATGAVSALASWLCVSLALWATYRSVGLDHASPLEAWPTWILAATLPMAAGFVVLLPGGIGVRDVMIVQLLAPQIGEEVALLTAALWRLVTVLAEVATCGILYVTRLRRARP